MSNKYDKILGEYREADFSSIYGDSRYFRLDQTTQQTIVGDFSALATAYGVKVLPTVNATDTTFGHYCELTGAHGGTTLNAGWFSAAGATTNIGVYAAASGGSDDWAGWFDGRIKTNGTPWFLYDNEMNQSFTLFEIANDIGGEFNGSPFRFFWDYDNQWLAFDDGANRQTLSANLYADNVSSSAFTGGTFSGESLVAMPTNAVNTVPIISQGASASTNVPVTFTYAAARTFTMTLASPAILTTAAPHGLTADHMVRLTTTGALYTGFNTTTLYYVRNPSGSNLELSLTPGGASINSSGTQSGTHTITPLCKCTTGVAHGRSANDPVIFGGGSPMPAGLTAGQSYYAGAGGLTSTVFYPKIATAGGVGNYVAITTGGGGSPYAYGQNADLQQWKNSGTTTLAGVDKYGNLYGSQATTAWRIGHIPADSNYSGLWLGTSAFSPTSSNYSFLADASNTFMNGTSYLWLRVGNVTQAYFSSGYFNFADNVNFVFGTTTGTKLGNATNQKLSFWGATAIIQPTTGVAAATRTGGGGTALTDTDTYDGYTIMQVVKALRNEGLLA